MTAVFEKKRSHHHFDFEGYENMKMTSRELQVEPRKETLLVKIKNNGNEGN